MFWASGKHIKTDLTETVDRFSLAHPKVRVIVATALGEATTVQAALADYALSCGEMTSKL
jgi:sirohydrochlorin ferrochelatase